MKRIVMEMVKPVSDEENPDPVSVYSVPEGSIIISTPEKTYVDYLTTEEAPEGAVYVGEFNDEDGTTEDIVGAKSDIAHNFAGWDREKAKEGIVMYIDNSPLVVPFTSIEESEE